MTALPTIGASELAVTVGLQQRRRDGTPYNSALELWARLRGLLPRYDTESSPAAEAGRTMELGIAARAERELELDLMPGPSLDEPGWSTSELPWLAVRPDFLGQELMGSTYKALVECKAPRELDESWGPVGTDQAPTHYVVQALAQIAVIYRLRGVELCYIAAHARDARWGDRVFGLWPIRRNEATEAALLQRAHDWYKRHVEDGVPPGPDGSESCGQVLQRLWRPVDTTVGATAEDLARYHELLKVRDALDELEGRRRELEQQLQARMGEATVLEHDGRDLATWRVRLGAARIDTKRLKREQPQIARAYTLQAEDGRQFRLERP